ncbi:hypothetical protein [Mycolicibacterium llatzerense]|uniref:hypothetical protein n=1 Tax=Mycolicibacterium llatzerense TaxID=280871 RepID=UPI0008DE9231|nr:hypothetical protein [Mycolicibacterium llatzerense]MCT7373330.1 hypothetical protein [Mycolicibacterium llatzerense]
MSDDETSFVPVWTLTTGDASIPQFPYEAAMTSERLAELRTVLAAMARTSIATLEVHPIPANLDKGVGLRLDSASPLAQQLSGLIRDASKHTTAVNLASTSEALYRMVVPAKVAAQVSGGIMTSMPSKVVAGGIHGALTNSSGGIAAQATFVQVSGPATTRGAAAGAGALTIATPLILMAVAVGISAHADNKRQKALERITELLEKLHQDRLDDERNQLDGCRDAIEKATAILLDRGKIGLSLGLDTAVGKIDTAVATAARRVDRWQQELAKLPSHVELSTLRNAFSGVDDPDGEFRAHLELARLAIALKRRVLVLQAVEHAQMDSDNPFQNFIGTLAADSKRIDQLDISLNEVLLALSRVKLTSSRRVMNMMVTSGEVNSVLNASYRIRDIGDDVESSSDASDVVIDIVRNADGGLHVLPARAL